MKKNRKVAIFLEDLECGGVERVMLDLSSGFIEKNLDVDFVLSKAQGDFLAQVPESVNVVDLKSKRVLFSLPKLIKYLRNAKPEIILSAVDHTNIISIISTLFNSYTKPVITIHNLSQSHNNRDNKNRLKEKVIVHLISLFYCHAASIIAVSKAAAEELASLIKVEKERISVVYNPVDFNRIAIRSEESIDHPWFNSANSAVVLAVGRLHYEKDYVTLIKAFRMVNEQLPLAKLIIMGSGPQQEELENLINEFNLQNNILLWGFEDNPYKYIKAADLLVLCSIYETLPTVLIEGIFLEKDFVCTQCKGGIKEIIGDYSGNKVGDYMGIAESIIYSLNKMAEKKMFNFEVFERSYAVDRYLAIFDRARS